MLRTVDIKLRSLRFAFLVDPSNAQQAREAIRLAWPRFGTRRRATDSSCVRQPSLQFTPFELEACEVLPQPIRVVRDALSRTRTVE